MGKPCAPADIPNVSAGQGRGARLLTRGTVQQPRTLAAVSHDFRIIARCPVPKLIAPFIQIVTSEARATVNSIYRGDDARALLNKYGKHSQAQLYQLFLDGRGAPANPPGFSTHELKSDGSASIANAYHAARGNDLPWWGQGFDVNDSDVDRCIAVARRYQWTLFRPYPSGSEFHHLNFRFEPVPHSLGTRLRVARLRATLPRG